METTTLILITIIFALIIPIVILYGLYLDGWVDIKRLKKQAKFDLARKEETDRQNTALKWANTKHKATIEELEEEHKKVINIWNIRYCLLKQKNKDQADTIKRMNSEFDEVHVLLETLLVTPKKKQAELVNQYIFTK